MLRNISLATLSVLFFFVSYTQDTTKSVTFSGSVDAYFRHNFANKLNNYTSFTNSQSSFELGMASLRADATALSGKVGATVDLGFGRRAEEFSYNDGNNNPASGIAKNGFLTLAAVKQAFVTYAPVTRLKFTLGKFATHIGYELVDAPLNRNYSMSYIFTNGPFSHTGLKADVTVGPVAFMVGVANYMDQATSTTSTKTLIAQFSGGTKNGKLKFYLNYCGFGGAPNGDNPGTLKSFSQIDACIYGIISSKFNIGYNGTVQSRKQISGSTTADGSWVGNALYLNFDPTSIIGITLRSEYISDDKTIYFPTKNIFANTLSLNTKVGPLTIIPELRFETAQSNIYLKNDGAGTKSTFTALLAAVYKF